MANEKSKVEIKGYTILEECNSKSKRLEEMYTPLEERLSSIYKEIKRLEKEREDIYNKIERLRIDEVNNVLDYIRHYVRYYKEKLKPNDIDDYLCHCQNMLNGNIDGIFLTFRDPTKDNKNEN